jgi:hypothetical protein
MESAAMPVKASDEDFLPNLPPLRTRSVATGHARQIEPAANQHRWNPKGQHRLIPPLSGKRMVLTFL